MREKNECQRGVVDVVVAAWNRADTIERAIGSALAEPEVRMVIVVDDASTDDTAVRAERLGAATNRVLIHRLPSNRGPSAARNRALELSSAPWVAILDGDDFFLPGRMGKLLAAADEIEFVADDVLQIEEAQIGSLQPKPMLSGEWIEPALLDFESFVLGNISRRGAQRRELGFLKPLMKRAFLDRHGLRYEETLRLGEDYALYAHALALGARFRVMPTGGYVSVIRSSSLSARHSKEDLVRLRDVDLKLGVMPNLSAADRWALRNHYRSVDAKVQWLGVIDAFKSRRLASFARPFIRSPEVSWFLVTKLFEQAWHRTYRLFIQRDLS
jgi:succinoglycan biosynthesis protein ExoU